MKYIFERACGTGTRLAIQRALRMVFATLLVASLITLTTTVAPSHPQPAAADTGAIPAVADIALGFTSCALTVDKDIYCWGSDPNLMGGGRNSITNVPLKIATVGGPNKYKAISVGDAACALDIDGKAWCWGRNDYGQIGDGTHDEKDVPTAVVTSLRFTKISSRVDHVCALDSNGTAYCWGRNNHGQLGNGTTGESTAPVAVNGHTFSDIQTGWNNTCGIASDTGNVGKVFCWGWNNNGKLGDNTNQDRQVPTAVTNAPGTFSAIALGFYHTCGIVAATKATYCWGRGEDGQLGDGNGTTQYQPTNPVSGNYQWNHVAVGDSQACGVTTSGATYCWGYNRNGELGDGTQDSQVSPVSVIDGHTFTRVAAGWSYSCGVAADGLWCWGQANDSRLGNGQLSRRVLPTPTANLPALSSVTGGYGHACGLTSSGEPWCWGDGRSGQLGTGWHMWNTPEKVNDDVFSSLSAADYHTCGVSGTIGYCWGGNWAGQLGTGDNDDQTVPTAVDTSSVVGGLPFSQITTARDGMTCGIRSTDNAAYCWGSNGVGQLGTGSSGGYANKPATAVAGNHQFTTISTGWEFACGLDNNQHAWCWGSGYAGELGNGADSDSATPVPINGNRAFAKLSVGGNHACGLMQSGQLYCWGRGDYGQIGDDGWGNRWSPVAVAGNYTDVKLGDHFSCALRNNGKIACWGHNSDWGELGDGTTTDRGAPTDIASQDTFVGLGTGHLFAFGFTADGRVFAWGVNSTSQLSTGDPILLPTPQRVLLTIGAYALPVTALIPAVLSLGITGYNAGTCNGATINRASSTASAVQLGDGSPTTNAVAGQTLTVSTNAAGGYVLYARTTGNLMSAVHTLTNWSGTYATPIAFPVPGIEAIGYTTDRIAAFSPNKWAGLSTSNGAVTTVSTPVSSDVTHMCYQLGMNTVTPAAQYSTMVIYTVVPGF